MWKRCLCMCVMIGLMTALPVLAQESTLGGAPDSQATAETAPSTRGIFTEPGIFAISQPYAGVERTYLVSIPEDYFASGAESETPYPLVVALHGAGGTGQRMVGITGLSAMSETEGFIVAYPDGLNGIWNDGREGDARVDSTLDDVGFIVGLIETLTEALNVDARRVYLTGYSMGGFLAQRIACIVPEQIAGIALVAATMPQYVLPDCADARVPMPTMIVHGTNDVVIPWIGVTTQNGGGYLSALDTAFGWANRNGCDLNTTIEALPDLDPNDGTRVLMETYTGCTDDASVVLVGVYRGGHTWAGRPFASLSQLGLTTMDFDATSGIWAFLSQHTRG